MGNQKMIVIDSEYGSGGREIARELAAKLNLPIYDKNIVELIAKEKKVDMTPFLQNDEAPIPFLTRHVGEHTTSFEEHLAYMTFDFIQEHADSGESFIVIGHCADEVLRDYEEATLVFITGNLMDKDLRIQNDFHVSSKQALSMIRKNDNRRKRYHNQYSSFNWGDSRGYDLCISSSPLDIAGTVDAIAAYINVRYN